MQYRSTRPLVQPIRQSTTQIVRNTIQQTVLHLHKTAAFTQTGREIDPSRPAWTAQRLLRVLSMESARRTLQPFYRDMFRGFWTQEREAYRSRPSQALETLRRLCLETVHTRYTTQELIVLEELHYLPPVREAPVHLEQQKNTSVGREAPPPAPLPVGRFRLEEDEFQALVRNVAGALNRQSRLERLRLGGM